MKNFDASFMLKQTPKLVARLSFPGENRPLTPRFSVIPSGYPQMLRNLDPISPKLGVSLVLELPLPVGRLTEWPSMGQQEIVALSNCYLSSKYGVQDFYQLWIDTCSTPTDPFIQNLLFLTHSTDQCLNNLELQQHLELENEAILALDTQITNETSTQMDRQNSDWIERATAQLAEANFQVLEDRLDASAKLEISNHLHQTDWVDLELSNQISDLCNDCIVSKRGGFRLTSGLAPGGSGGGSGHGGSGGRGFGGNPGFGPPENPKGPIPTGLVLVLWGATLVGLYSLTRWVAYKFSEALSDHLSQLTQWENSQETVEEKITLKRAWKAFYVFSAKGAVLVFSAVVGEGPLRQAVRQIVLPELQRAAAVLQDGAQQAAGAAIEALVPPQVLAALRDLAPVVRAGRYVWQGVAVGLSRIVWPALRFSWPIVRSCLGVGAILAVCPALLEAYESVATAVEPILVSATATLPSNIPLQSVFFSRVLQITGGTYLCSGILTTTGQAIERPSVWRVARIFVPMAGLYVVLCYPYYFSVSVLQKNFVLQTLLNCQMGRLTLLIIAPLFLKMLRVPHAEIPYMFLLYYLQMYQIALSATPNMFS